jgi:phosphoribosylformylglycinamidine synthase
VPAVPAGTAGTFSEWEIFRANTELIALFSRRGMVCSAYPVGPGGVATALAIAAFGNRTGVEVPAAVFDLPGRRYQGSALIELAGSLSPEEIRGIIAESGVNTAAQWIIAAMTLDEPLFRVVRKGQTPAGEVEAGQEGGGGVEAAETPLAVLRRAYEHPLAQIYPQTSPGTTAPEEPDTGSPQAYPATPGAGVITDGYRRKDPPEHTGKYAVSRSLKAKPLVILPVFPGTNCEWDMERAFREAGAETRLVVFRNRNREDIIEATRELASAIGASQIIALSGGFSAGDEPEGSGKFIANVFRAPAVAEAVTTLLEKRNGLVLGICNGFQALIKLGLVPYGVYRDADKTMPTLSFNRIGRHVSRMVRTRVMSNLSPWFAREEPGRIHVLPVSHGEGRLVIRPREAEELFKRGQVPCCYADQQGKPALTEPDNPNGSDFAIEALSSPDGRVLGKMAHSERRGEFVHINIPGNKYQSLFEAGVGYFE